MTAKDGGSGDVGYARPPKRTQFKPGQSGNPKGRPKPSNHTGKILQKILEERVWVRFGARRVKLSKLEAMIIVNVAKARENYRALASILKADDKLNPPPPPPAHKSVVTPQEFAKILEDEEKEAMGR